MDRIVHLEDLVSEKFKHVKESIICKISAFSGSGVNIYLLLTKNWNYNVKPKL